MIASAFDELDYDYAASVAQKALQGMAAQQVPATPDNFGVWFVYSMGVPSDLQRAIDVLIGNKRKFDATINRDLFSTYVAAPDGSAAALASQQLHAVMDAAQVFLATAIADNHAQMRAIHDVADQGQAGSDPMLYNEPGAPPRVPIVEGAAEPPTSLAIPPYSATVYRWEVIR